MNLVAILGFDVGGSSIKFSVMSEEGQVGSAEHYYPEAGEVAEEVGHPALDAHHYGATKYHRHKDARSNSGVLAKAFNSHVEDSTPHHGSAETYEQHGEDANGHILRDEGHC